jgi:dipeptidase E
LFNGFATTLLASCCGKNRLERRGAMDSRAKTKNIIAIGGALAKSQTAGPLLLDYVFSISGKERPNVLIVNTASGDEESTAAWTFRAIRQLACVPTELTFFKRTPLPKEMRELILSQDVIWVNGGNTKSMLAVWHAYGVPDILRQAWDNGIVLAGSSAGGICWYEQCLTDSYSDEYTALDCLGFLPGSCCPHFDGEQGRKATYHRLIEQGELKAGIAIDERVAVHYIGDKMHRVISTDRKAGAYRVRLAKNRIVQKGLRSRCVF